MNDTELKSDLEIVAKDIVEKFLRSETCIAKIAATVEKTVLDVIENTLRTYSDFGKSVTKIIYGPTID